jgi:rhamnulokinase
VTTPDPLHVAIDLGAGSGRAVVGGFTQGCLRWTEVHRFHYAPREHEGHLRWNLDRLLDGMRMGIQRAQTSAREWKRPLASVGVDSWGVDYALLDREGRLVEEPICYRDDRTRDAMDQVCSRVGRDELYARTGIQFQTFNTLFQLWAHVRDGFPAAANHLLLIPDFCHHVLCGELSCERTNASTTQLLTAGTCRWDHDLIGRLGLPRHILPPIVEAGVRLGTLSPSVTSALAVRPMAVVAPGTHDTASAVAGTPLQPGWAFISSGTWSLVGVECDAPVLSRAAARAGLTNEAGVGGKTRLLANVMGLWLLDSCRREWEAAGQCADLSELLTAVEAIPAPAGVVYPDDRRFFGPPSMIEALRRALSETGQDDAAHPARIAKIILDSLALRYASVLGTIERVTGTPIRGIHIVGGGALNTYLNQAAADAAGRPVIAGPVEATAAGNLLVQAMATGTLGSVEDGRHHIAAGSLLARFEPRNATRFEAAARLFASLEASMR